MIACQSKCWLRSNCGNVAFSLNLFELNESSANLRNEFLCSPVSATSRALRVQWFPCPVHSSFGLSTAEWVRSVALSNPPAAIAFILHVTLEGRKSI